MASPGSPPPSPPQREGTTALLRVTHTVTLVWILIGALVGLLALLGIVFALLAVHYPVGEIGTLVYAAVWIMVDMVILGRIGTWSNQIARGETGAVQEPLLLWGILALIFGVVPGILLLIVYVQIQPWAGGQNVPNGGTGPVSQATDNPPPPPVRGLSVTPAAREYSPGQERAVVEHVREN